MSRTIYVGVQSLILGVPLALILACSQGKRPVAPTEVSRPSTSDEWVGKPAPPFHLFTLTGKEVSLEDYRGKFLLLYSFHPA